MHSQDGEGDELSALREPRIGGWSRRRLIGAALALPMAGCLRPDPVSARAQGHELVRRGLEALLSFQNTDGAFREPAHESLRVGPWLTALCVSALSLYWPAVAIKRAVPYPERAVVRGMEYLGSERARNAALGFGQTPPARPLASTALAIETWYAHRPIGHADTTAPMLWWLRGQQHLEGFEGAAAYGGFSSGQWWPVDEQTNLSPDVHLTLRAMMAMQAMGIDGTDPAFRAAARFVDGCAVEGGFAAIPGGRFDQVATVASQLCLVLADRALPGVVAPTGWKESVNSSTRYADHIAALFAKQGGPVGWQDDLIRRLASRQRADGSWADEPAPVATAWALRAVITALRSTG